MDREQLIDYLLTPGLTTEKLADFILRHTEELRKQSEIYRLETIRWSKAVKELEKENEELKTIVSRLQGSLNAPATTAMSIMNDVYKERLENDRLRGLVDSVEIALHGEGYHYEQVEDALAKIAEYKNNK